MVQAELEVASALMEEKIQLQEQLEQARKEKMQLEQNVGPIICQSMSATCIMHVSCKVSAVHKTILPMTTSDTCK